MGRPKGRESITIQDGPNLFSESGETKKFQAKKPDNSKCWWGHGSADVLLVTHAAAAAAAAKSCQSCPTLCDPIDGSPPGSPDPGILQARTLEWGAIAFSV